jgi:hypothetical protein
MLKTVTNIINASQIQTPITLPGDVTLSTGNLVIGTSGKGIDFSATPGTGTSELFSDYEEGTFSPVIADALTGGNVASFGGSGFYTKIGRQVTVYFTSNSINTTGLTAGNAVCFRGFPFTSSASNAAFGSYYTYRVGGGAGQSASVFLGASGTAARINIYTGVSATTDTNIKVSDLVSGTSSVYFSLTYFV